jgi:hypothetical protein
MRLRRRLFIAALVLALLLLALIGLIVKPKGLAT